MASVLRYLSLFIILFTVTAGYDEANCEKRSNEVYHTSICDLPLGGKNIILSIPPNAMHKY